MIYSVGHFTYLVLIWLFDFVIGIAVDCWNTVVNKISNTFSDFEFRSLQLTSSPVICVCVTGEQETQTLIHHSLSWNDKPSLTRHFILAIEVHVPSRWQCKMFAHSPPSFLLDLVFNLNMHGIFTAVCQSTINQQILLSFDDDH